MTERPAGGDHHAEPGQDLFGPAGGSHAEDIDLLTARLGTDPARGLSGAVAAERLRSVGPNELPKEPGPSALRRFAAQFANPIVLTLVAAAVIATVHGVASQDGGSFLVRYGDATAILIIIVMNALLGFYQERRAGAALDALQKMQTPIARVRRDGATLAISAVEVVPGDVLELEAGDAVPADARLLQTANLYAEESAMTGESVPVGKDALAVVPADATLGDRANTLFVGTNIVRGRARAVVVATGTRTEIGKLNALIQGVAAVPTPLEDKLNVFGKKILWICLGLSGLIFARGMIAGRQTWHDLLLEAVSLAVAAIPEGLPAITTITLALGMSRMAKRGAIVRKLAAVETLGAATVICSDKTGTLTQNQMTVREVHAGGVTYSVTGGGYDPQGAIVDPRDGKAVSTPAPALERLLATVALCNNATLGQAGDGSWRVTGDPTEGALLTLAAKGGMPRESVSALVRVVKELPFDSDRKRMSILTLDDAGCNVLHTKGSAEVLLPMCESYASPDGDRPLDDAMRAKLLAETERMSGQALRVLAVARRELGEAPKDRERGDGELEEALTFVGLVGMIDPPRPGVKESVRACAAAHVRAVMITGDHKLTAVAIARELGLWDDGAIALTGSEIEQLSLEELQARVDRVRVFARVTAEQKLRIVRAFKACGHVVAMTGDGVNDAPALREAHIGIAMGKDGTDVARQAADMVIADDDFSTIVHAVREGRAIYRDIQKFIYFLLSSNAGLLVAVFVGSFMKDTLPLTPLMILWINLVTNGLPALALGVDPPDPTQMMEPPRKTSDGLLTSREYLGMAAVGVWMGAAALALYLWPWPNTTPLDAGDDGPRARALAFSLLALSPLFHAFSCRSATRSIGVLRPLVSRVLVGALLASAAIHLVAVLVPGLRPVFRTFHITGYEWTVMLLLAVSIVPAIEALKWLQRARVIGGDLGPMSHRL